MKNPPVSERRGGETVARVICEAVDCKYNSKGGCTVSELHIADYIACKDYEEEEE